MITSIKINNVEYLNKDLSKEQLPANIRQFSINIEGDFSDTGLAIAPIFDIYSRVKDSNEFHTIETQLLGAFLLLKSSEAERGLNKYDII